MTIAARVKEELLELLILARFVFEWRKLLQSEVLEVFIKSTDAGSIFGFVIGMHDGVGHFHICESIKHRDFSSDCVLVVDERWAISPEDMRDGRVVLVCPFLDDLPSILVVLVFGKTWVFDETGKLL